MGNAAEYFIFFKWESKILLCSCIFDKHFWIKNKGTIIFTNHFYLGWKENSLKVARLDFLGGYLPSLSINYVGMRKDMETRLPQLYYIKMKISYDLDFIAIEVTMAT